ncbi:MAG: ABC transporter permease subunit, partial [Bacillota bacterium]|nr:ABC transporter permease subunit [Bacillota bacterium]
MNIIKRELRSNRKSLIIWAIVMFFMAYACMNKYSAGNAIPGGFNELMKTLPLGMQKMLGVGVFDLSNPIDYYAICFPYLALLTCIQAVMLGASVISKEERDKTTEFLMVKPVSREQILTSKFIASFVI